MIQRPPVRAAVRRLRTGRVTTGVTAFGCGPHEATLFRELSPRFGVTPTITDEAVTAGNVGLAAGNRCISVGHKSRIDDSLLLALSGVGVEYVSTRSIGDNHIDVAYAESIGVTVGTVAYSPDSVADYTVMLMLMALRHATSVVRRADLRDYRLHDTPGRELRDLTVGVVGTGRIGAAVIDRLRGFGSRIVAHDVSPATRADYVTFDELIRVSDVVTLHTPLTPATHHLLDARRLEQMKPGAVIVNTGRGPLLDNAALLAALESGHLAGVALDVVEGEEGVFYADCRERPLASTPLARLQELPNVLISPHTAYFTDHALADAVEDSLAHCLTYENGNP